MSGIANILHKKLLSDLIKLNEQLQMNMILDDDEVKKIFNKKMDIDDALKVIEKFSREINQVFFHSLVNNVNCSKLLNDPKRVDSFNRLISVLIMHYGMTDFLDY